MTTKPLISIRILVAFLVGVFTTHAAVAASDSKSGRIKKCQDSAGRWHYGDTADAACARSKVIELSKEGVQTREISAPLTEAELAARAAREAEAALAKKRAEAQAASDRQLLATYGHEDDIALARDRKLADLDATIKTTEETQLSLRAAYARARAQAADETAGGKKMSAETAKELAHAETQVRKHDEIIAAKQAEKEKLREKSVAELARYRELKSQPLPAASALPTP